MDEWWPRLDEGVLAHLQRVFQTPLKLDAAFDNDEECLMMLNAEFPDMVAEDAMDSMAILVLWKEAMARPLKRARGELVRSSLYRLPLPGQLSVQEEFARLTRTSAICILEMHVKQKQRRVKEDPADARAKRFEAERRKYSRLLAQVIEQAKLPIVELVKTLEDPRSAWLHLFAARRANTLKNRYKVWRPFEQWLEWHRGYLYPRGVRDAVDYMQHRVNDGCGKTVPQSLHAALSLLEQLGRVPSDARISEDPLWLGHVKSWSAELAETAEPRKPAEMYTVAMLLALELTVVDETEALFTSALAWIVLCMVWGAMRCDDMQSVIPHRSILSNYGLRLVLGRSKTTGPDKPQKEISVHILRTTSLTGEDWLKVGYDMWSEDPFNFRRDYMVMEPNKSWTGVKKKFMAPSCLGSAISKLLGGLALPRRAGLSWELMPAQLLLPDGLESFFSGHSPRNFVTSVAAALGFSKDERAYLGRWSMGMVSSEEYVRTSRQVIYKIQKAVNKALVEGGSDPYHEDEPISRLCEFAAAGGANPNRIKKRHTVLVYGLDTGAPCLGGVFPTLQILPEDWDEDDGRGGADAELADKVAMLAAKEATASQHTAKYFVTISRRTAMRRLHMAGCFVKPDRCCEVVFMDEVAPDSFESICQACKKRMMLECGKEAPELSTSTASSSSTASPMSEGNEPTG